MVLRDVSGKGFFRQRVICFPNEDRDLFFSFVQHFGTALGKRYAFFKAMNRLFKGQIACFEFLDDLFQLLNGFFKC